MWDDHVKLRKELIKEALAINPKLRSAKEKMKRDRDEQHKVFEKYKYAANYQEMKDSLTGGENLY